MSLVVEQALGLVTVQDLGRPGHMHEGLAPGGALAPSFVAELNAECGNARDAAVIEVLGKVVVRAERDVHLVVTHAEIDRASHSAAKAAARSPGVAIDPKRRHSILTHRHVELAAGQELVIESEPVRVAYIALAGGIDAPVVLGSRATQLSAGIGALLRAGDRIATSTAPGKPSPEAFAWVWREPSQFHIVPGPDHEAFAPDALATLCAGSYRIQPTSDRVGTRLHGATLPRSAGYLDRSRPGVRGAIEVPPDGQPIVLGPEHPTTIGYTVIAVIVSGDLDRFHLTRVGGEVRFFHAEVGHGAHSPTVST